MALPRKPDKICYQLLSTINKKRKASKWELIKILGNETAFNRWVDDVLVKYGALTFSKEKVGGKTVTYYMKTEKGEVLHRFLEKFLRDGKIMELTSRILFRKRLLPDRYTSL